MFFSPSFNPLGIATSPSPLSSSFCQKDITPSFSPSFIVFLSKGHYSLLLPLFHRLSVKRTLLPPSPPLSSSFCQKDITPSFSPSFIVFLSKGHYSLLLPLFHRLSVKRTLLPPSPPLSSSFCQKDITPSFSPSFIVFLSKGHYSLLLPLFTVFRSMGHCSVSCPLQVLFGCIPSVSLHAYLPPCPGLSLLLHRLSGTVVSGACLQCGITASNPGVSHIQELKRSMLVLTGTVFTVWQHVQLFVKICP